MQGAFRGLGLQEFDVETARARMLRFGKQMRRLVYPLTYAFNGLPTVTAFSIQLDEAREDKA
jgi:hypothetical protein